MNRNKIIKLDKNYIPLPSIACDEIFPNGIFNFIISRILEHIDAGLLEVDRERINVRLCKSW
jgi:hypothetical protein